MACLTQKLIRTVIKVDKGGQRWTEVDKGGQGSGQRWTEVDKAVDKSVQRCIKTQNRANRKNRVNR